MMGHMPKEHSQMSAAIRRMRTKEPYLSMRRVFLSENPLCRPCAANGFTVAAAARCTVERLTWNWTLIAPVFV